MDKSERKRFREKRRRDRVNASFDELRALMIRIDPQCSNRVDISQLELIDRSIVVIKGLLDEISRNRQRLKDADSVDQQGENKKVTVTLPFVNPFENESPASQQQSKEQVLSYPDHQGGIIHPNNVYHQVQQHTQHNIAAVHPLSTEQASRFDAQFFPSSSQQQHHYQPLHHNPEQSVNMWGPANPNSSQQQR
jgi:hypothetical protein